MLPALLALLTQIISLAAFSFTFLELWIKWLFTRGKLLPNDSSLGEPEGMLLKINSGSDVVPQVFGVSGVTMNSGFSRRGRCLSNTGLKESQKFMTIITNLHNFPGGNDSNPQESKSSANK